MASEPAAAPPPAEDLGDLTLFLPKKYRVKTLGATLGGINLADITKTSLAGIKVGDSFDAVLRNVRVTSSKNTADGDVTLILYADNIELAGGKGLAAVPDPEEDDPEPEKE